MKVLIWDFDGTLALRAGMWTGALIEVMDEHVPGHSITREQIRPYLQQGFPWHNPDVEHQRLSNADDWWLALIGVLTSAFIGVGVDSGRAEVLAGCVRERFCAPEGWSLYPDVISVLSELSALGWTDVILSNHVPELPSIVSALGLDEWIDFTVTSAAIGVEKPHPEAFRHVLDRIGEVEEVWMIGDSLEADVKGAARVGIPGILVRSQMEGVEGSCLDLYGVIGNLTRGG